MVTSEVQEKVLRPTLSVVVPAYNEENGLPDTIESLLAQSEAPDRVIVVDDCSSDRTREIALSYPGVECITTPENLGSKARAQNYALPFINTDLVLAVDGDTVLAGNYIEAIKAPFIANDNVAIAAGRVETRYKRTVWERGRAIEYLIGFNFHRPIQDMARSPMVCSGCNSAFRTHWLKAFGGFPDRTMVEDVDYTWAQQIAGRDAVYVGTTTAYAAEPDTCGYLRKQLWRWKAGWFQNVRMHFKPMLRQKPMLGLWVVLALLEIIAAPVIIVLPILAVVLWERALWMVATSLVVSETVMVGMPLTYAIYKGRVNPWEVLRDYPSFYVLKAFNFYYDWKAVIVELILVPLRLTKGLSTYEKGH